MRVPSSPFMVYKEPSCLRCGRGTRRHTWESRGSLSSKGHPKSIDIAPGTTFQVCLLLVLFGASTHGNLEGWVASDKGSEA